MNLTVEASADDPQDVAFLHDDQVFARDLDLGARPFAEQDAVAGLDVQRIDLAVFVAGTGAHGNDHTLGGLFLGGIGDDDPARGLFIGLDSAKEKPQEGEVVAAGTGAKSEDGKVTPLDVKAGDRVLFGKWSGTEVKLDGEDLLIMKESDIMGIVG